jgi:hypothetical protein
MLKGKDANYGRNNATGSKKKIIIWTDLHVRIRRV